MAHNLSAELEAARMAVIRKMIQEEVVRALRMMAREADHLDTPYDTPELDSRALSNIVQVAKGTVGRLTCEHARYQPWGGELRCTRCDELAPAPENPFEEEERG